MAVPIRKNRYREIVYHYHRSRCRTFEAFACHFFPVLSPRHPGRVHEPGIEGTFHNTKSDPGADSIRSPDSHLLNTRYHAHPSGSQARLHPTGYPRLPGNPHASPGRIRMSPGFAASPGNIPCCRSPASHATRDGCTSREFPRDRQDPARYSGPERSLRNRISPVRREY